jgi:hypothetical protein
MDWQALLDPAIQNFIKAHEKSDVARLALSKSLPEPRALILDQIKSRAKAAKKIPQWLECADIILSPADIIEQASSTATALFKSSLVQQGNHFIDLTGGAGVDSWAFAQKFTKGDIIEQNPDAAILITHNIKTLGHNQLTIHNVRAEDFVQTMPETDLVYVDPARRNIGQRGIFKLNECSPDILTLLPVLQEKAKAILIKTSPMLDIDRAYEELGNISHIYAIEYQGECKELLFLIKPQETTQNPVIHAVTLNDDGSARHHISSNANAAPINDYLEPVIGQYLYEPGPSLQKTALFAELAAQYDLHKIARDTHLFTSNHKIENFPGRSFQIQGLYEPRKKNLPFTKANLTIRNFPAHTPELLKKLGLKEGGNDYLFACALHNGSYCLIHCIK